MNKLEQLRGLRQYISRAREACAGSNVKELTELYRLVRDAWVYASSEAYGDIADKLFKIWGSLDLIKDYGDRLPIDNELCDMLNSLDKKIEGLE